LQTRFFVQMNRQRAGTAHGRNRVADQIDENLRELRLIDLNEKRLAFGIATASRCWASSVMSDCMPTNAQSRPVSSCLSLNFSGP
jgi:hypothetical protein